MNSARQSSAAAPRSFGPFPAYLIASGTAQQGVMLPVPGGRRIPTGSCAWGLAVKRDEISGRTVLMTPRQVGNYRLDSLLGSGATGQVYRAYDTYRDRHVALKLLPEGFADDQEYLKRFQSESHVAAQMREPHVIPIHDYGEIGSQIFIDMHLVDGAGMGALLDGDDRIDPQRAVHLIDQVAQALDAAHADDLGHRDIKPSNILVTPNDFVYVVDFGIARSIGDWQTAAAS